MLSEQRYEIIDQHTQTHDDVLSYMMGKHLVQGIAYFCLLENRRPMSTSEMSRFLRLSDSLYIDRFNEAVTTLVQSGFIREVK